MVEVEKAPRELAADRLEGMDVYKMLDLNGDGLIHQVVLARTLHIFDQSVFSQPVVQEMLDSLVRKVPDRTDGKVPLQAVMDHIAGMPSRIPSARSVRSGRSDQAGQGGSGSRTPQVRSGSRTPLRSGSRTPVQGSGGASASAAAATPLGSRTPSKTPQEAPASVDAYTDSLVCDIRGFHEVVKPEAIAEAAGTSPEEIAALREQLKAHAKQYVIDAQRRNICPLWDEFDKDGNGVLDPTECTALVASYLHAMAGKSSEIIRGSIELGIELSLIISEKTVKDEATRQQMRKHARLQVEAIHANVAPLVQQMLDKMADEDPHTIAGELLSTLDFDSDGKVTRDEFEQRFVESMQYVLGPEGLMDKLQRVNSLSNA